MHLRHLCRADGRISSLTTLHLTFQCSEQVLIKVLKYLVLLQELVLSVAYPSPSWQSFLESLTAKPCTNEWPALSILGGCHSQLEEWCSSQTWNVNILPHLKFLGIKCTRGFSRLECLENLPFFRLIGWTRAHLTPPLEHLNVWEGRGSMGDIVVDYISTGYQDKHLGISGQEYDAQEYDAILVMGMATRCLVIEFAAISLFAFLSTVLFRRLWHLELFCDYNDEIPTLTHLEQIKRLEICGGNVPEYSSNLDLPLTHTLQWLKLRLSTSSWMLGRTFKTLREFEVSQPLDKPENQPRHEGLQVDLPVCTTLQLENCPMDYLRFLSCSNVQTFRWQQFQAWTTFDLTALNSLLDFVSTLSCLKSLYIFIPQGLAIDSLIHFVFGVTPEQRAWRDIRSVGVEIRFNSSSEAYHFFKQTAGHHQWYSDSKNWFTFGNFFLARPIVAQITKLNSWKFFVTKQGILALFVPNVKTLASCIDLIQHLQ